MITKKTFITSFILFFSCCSYGQKLIELWRTDPVLKTPESALYDASAGVIYVSNINGNPKTKDGNGFISRLNPVGAVRNLNWVTGLNAPKGMAVYDHKLYVADIDELVQIDSASGKITGRFSAPGAIFLNDVAAGNDGKIYVSDTGSNKIYVLHDQKMEIWTASSLLKNINGLYAEDTCLYVGSDKIQCISIKTKKITTIQEKCGEIDGLTKDNAGHFVFSNWSGRIFYRAKGKITKMLETAPEKINTADISYARALRLLLVPTFKGGQVVAYQIEK